MYAVVAVIAAALAAIAVVGEEAVVPAGIAIMTVLTCGPVAPFIPGVYEPLLVAAGALGNPYGVLVSALAAAVTMELVNWHAFGWLGESRAAERVRDSRFVRFFLRRFQSAPLATVALISFSPIPFLFARFLALWHRVPVAAFLAAFALGRLPRFALLVAIGRHSSVPPVAWLLAAGAVALVLLLLRGIRALGRPLLAHEAP